LGQPIEKLNSFSLLAADAWNLIKISAVFYLKRIKAEAALHLEASLSRIMRGKRVIRK